MKMKLWKRITVMALAVLGVLAVAAALLEAFGCGYSEALREFIASAENKYNASNLCVLLAVCALLVALCVCVFMIAVNSGRVKKAKLITLEDNSGDCILIAQDTLDTLVMNAIGEPQGVSDIKVVTGYQDGRVEAMIDIAVSSNINIPKTTRELQERVRRQLDDRSGICVSRVNVTISKINVPEDGENELPEDALKPDSEDTIEFDKVEEQEEEKVEEAKETEKFSVMRPSVIEVPPQVELPTPPVEAESEEISEEAEAETAEEEATACESEEEEPFFSPEVDFDTDAAKDNEANAEDGAE